MSPPNNTITLNQERLRAMLAAARSRNDTKINKQESNQCISNGAILTAELQQSVTANSAVIKNPGDSKTISAPVAVSGAGSPIQYNAEQQAFIDLATQMQSCILIGAAGTGKTTCMRGTATSLELSGKLPIIPADEIHKYLPTKVPGIVFCAFTRRAVNNLRKNLPDNLKGNAITIHKLLEYEPQYFDVLDPVTGNMKSTMRFTPTRNHVRPIGESIRTIVFEESSMISVELFNEVLSACGGRDVQFIFLGDIQQLPPVFGSAILGYKMLELPTIELTQVYRQALESPIIRLAHRILSGKVIPSREYMDWKVPNQLTLHPWKKKLHEDIALLTVADFFRKANDAGAYDPDQDMILIPFNKGLGTTELNKHIAQHLSRKRDAAVHEIIAGFNKHYYAIGDKVLYDKEDAVILDIKPNPAFVGASYLSPSTALNYWGQLDAAAIPAVDSVDSDTDINSMDFLLDQAAATLSGDNEDRVKVGSHQVTLLLKDTEREIVIDTASELNALILAYALTVHKSQGSEWRKVFCVFHRSHATMMQRELLYTAVTRAREELYIICEPETFTNAIQSQRIKGNTLKEKAEFFKGKQERLI